MPYATEPFVLTTGAMESWEEQYRAGCWQHLRAMKEVARFGVVAGYVHHFVERGSVLDAGCGEGLLLPFLDRARVGRYVGFDISPTALAQVPIDRARDELAEGSLESYRTDEKFDAVIFNEVLVFAQDPIATVDRFRANLKPEGAMILSIYQTNRPESGARTMTRQLWDHFDRGWTVLDEVELTNRVKDITWRLRAVR